MITYLLPVSELLNMGINRRTVLAGTMLGLSTSIGGCAEFTKTRLEADTKPLDRDLDRATEVGFYHGEQELGRFGIHIGAWVNVPYEFKVSAAAGEGLEWETCEFEFAFPNSDIRPPYIYLHGDTPGPINAERRRVKDEFTTFKLPEPTDGFEIECRAEPGGSIDEVMKEIPMEVRFDGRLIDNGIQGTAYEAEGSVTVRLLKALD